MTTRLSVVALASLSLAIFILYSLRKAKCAQLSRIGRSSSLSKPFHEGLAVLHADIVSGTTWCAGIAIFLCLLMRESVFRSLVPIFFLLVVLGIASRFGAAAGSLGTVVSAAVFAGFLFDPVYSLAVSNPGERTNLGWMVLGGLVISNLFGISKQSKKSGRP